MQRLERSEGTALAVPSKARVKLQVRVMLAVAGSRGNPLRNFMLSLIWNPNVKAGDYVIHFLSRGAPGGTEAVRGDAIRKVYLRGFDAWSGGRVIYVPFHRVLRVENTVMDAIVYEKKKG